MTPDSALPKKPRTTLPGMVEEILKPANPDLPEVAQISVGADRAMEIHIENSLKKPDGQIVGLKQGVPVDVIIESDPAGPIDQK